MISDFLSMLFPASCINCGDNITNKEKLICTSCRTQLPITNHHLDQENDFKSKFYGKLPVKQAYAYLKYIKSGVTQKLLHQLKYRGLEEVSEFIGNWHVAQIKESTQFIKPDLITYVPLHKSKLKKRGYNQVNKYATAISDALDIPIYPNILKRTHDTKTQTKKGRYDRWKNVDEIFVINQPEIAKGKDVLLTDDVVTTGATLEACGNRLLEAGAKSVSFMAMATA